MVQCPNAGSCVNDCYHKTPHKHEVGCDDPCRGGVCCSDAPPEPIVEFFKEAKR